MLFFSDLLEQKVIDGDGRTAGRLHDIGMRLSGGFPQSQFMVIARTRRGRRETVAVPWEWVASLEKAEIRLNKRREAIWKSDYPPQGLLLARNLLDRQIVDLHGNKVVRVNDLYLTRSDSILRLTGVDVSQKALLRRLGLQKTLGGLLRLMGRELPERTIPWSFVAPLELERRNLQLTITQHQLAALHPTDLADIIEQLEPYHRERLLDLLGSFMAAESLSEVEPGKQANVIEDLTETRASNLLEIMPPDEAADILANLPRDKAERLLNIMGVEEAGVIRELLGYAEDTAGGRMTPEFLAVPSIYSASDCLGFLRENAPDAEILYYLYVVDDEVRLKGVISLRDLLTSPPGRRVEDFMNRDVVAVNVGDDQEMVADIMSRYNFLALPVVDDGNFIKGIITVDDMIDVMREEAIEDLGHLGGLELAEAGTATSLRSRLPSVIITLIGGMAAALLLSAFEAKFLSLLALVFFLPMILRASKDVGVFSQAVIMEAIGGRDLAWREVLGLAWKETRIVLLLSLGLGLTGGLIAGFWESNRPLGITIALTLFGAVMLGMLVGILMPLVYHRLRGELRYTQARFSSLFISVATLAVYMGMAAAIL